MKCLFTPKTLGAINYSSLRVKISQILIYPMLKTVLELWHSLEVNITWSITMRFKPFSLYLKMWPDSQAYFSLFLDYSYQESKNFTKTFKYKKLLWTQLGNHPFHLIKLKMTNKRLAFLWQAKCSLSKH
jgi:hypothetical protein